MKKVKKICPNCGDGYGKVPVCINCPNCAGNGYNELSELRMLADWVFRNFESRSRSRCPNKAIELVNRVRKSQGRSMLWEK